MINQHRLINFSENGNPIGIHIRGLKPWVLETVPFHADLRPYVQVHLATKTKYFSILADHLSAQQIVQWSNQIRAATVYIEKLVDHILEHDETTYLCDLIPHRKGDQCPNRIGIILPEP